MFSLSTGSVYVGFYCGAFLLAILLALLLTRAVRDLAMRRDWIEAPSLSRHVHRKPVPRIGGIAIYASSWFAAATVVGVLSLADMNAAHRAAQAFVPIFVPATLIFGLGLLDDFRNLQAKTKLAGQVTAALWLYASGLRITRVDLILGNRALSPLLGLPLTILWVIVITNAFNLIDGLDGLAAGSAFFSTLIVFLVSILGHSPFTAMLAAALAGAILGFLRYNFNPASIFLGDSGSLYIGFILSALALTGSQKSSTMVAVAVPVVSFGLPIVDVSIAILRRFLRGRPLFEADAEHIHHKLLKRGVSHRDAVLILYAVSAAFGLLSLLLYPAGNLVVLVVTAIALGLFLGLQQLRYHEFSELQRVAHRTMNQKVIIANNLAIRRAAEALENCGEFEEISAVVTEHLQSIGFDAFVIRSSNLDEVPEVALAPFVRMRSNVVKLGTARTDSVSFRLEFRLNPNGAEDSPSFSLIKESFRDPLWVDPNVFVSSGFTAALNTALHRALRASRAFEKFDKVPEEVLAKSSVPAPDSRLTAQI